MMKNVWASIMLAVLFHCVSCSAQIQEEITAAISYEPYSYNWENSVFEEGCYHIQITDGENDFKQILLGGDNFHGFPYFAPQSYKILYFEGNPEKGSVIVSENMSLKSEVKSDLLLIKYEGDEVKKTLIKKSGGSIYPTHHAVFSPIFACIKDQFVILIENFFSVDPTWIENVGYMHCNKFVVTIFDTSSDEPKKIELMEIIAKGEKCQCKNQDGNILFVDESSFEPMNKSTIDVDFKYPQLTLNFYFSDRSMAKKYIVSVE